MLQCTPAAAATLEEVRERNSIPADYGVRVFASEAPEGGVGLGISFAPEPHGGDQVSEQHGTTLIVAPEVSDQLDGLTLDVGPDPSSDGAAAPTLVLRPASEN